MIGNGFDIAMLSRLVADHGPVVRAVVADVKGSTPREAGAVMYVWDNGQTGTIGGGMLEWQAERLARGLVYDHSPWARKSQTFALGPDMGQCCGGAVTLLMERFSQRELDMLKDFPVSGIKRPMRSGRPPVTYDGDGLGFDGKDFAEPQPAQTAPIWLYGAGHVGRAVVDALAPFGRSVTWVDIEADKFPDDIPPYAKPLMAKEAERVVPLAPSNAVHLVMTCAHPVDLAICHAVLQQPFAYLGLIGSATKAARFRKRLREAGTAPAQLDRMICPMGDPRLGKAPAAVALGIVAHLLATENAPTSVEEPA